MYALRTAASILAVSLLAGCSLVGAGSPSMADEMSPDRDEDATTVARVSNQSWYNVRVYVVDSGRRQSLGSVPSYRTTTFEMPRDMVRSSGQIQMLADPVGSTEHYRSSPVLVGPGQVVKWTVQNDRSQTYSSIVVQ